MKPKRKQAEFAALLTRSPSETAPLLLELAQRQAARRTPADLLAQLSRDRFVHTSLLDQRVAHKLDGLALDAARGFEALLLSPVAPLGMCSVLAPTSQDRTLSSTRGSEVVSDPTNMLALVCAARLKADPQAQPRLCTVHQVLRAQALPEKPGFSRHFRLLALAEAGPARGEDAFEVEAIVRQVGVFDRLMDSATIQGFAFPRRALTLFASPERHVLRERVRTALAHRHPHIEVHEESFSSAYYAGLRVLFGASSSSGEHVPLADTGVFDWVARLTANARMRFVASGMGIQLIPVLFGGV